MSTLYSRYLEAEIQVNLGEAVQGSTKKIVVSHQSLEDVIFSHALVKNKNVSCTYEIASADINHSVVVCNVKDNTGRNIQAVGELLINSSSSAFEKQYPTLLASQKAFDRAVIRYLDFPTQVYSNTEINVPIIEGSQKNYCADMSDSPAVPVTEQEIQAGVGTTPLAQNVQSSNTSEAKAEPEANQEQPQNESDSFDENCGNVVVSMGKYQGKGKTVAELYAEDKSWLEYIISSIHPKREDLKNQIAAAQLYYYKQEKGNVEKQ